MDKIIIDEFIQEDFKRKLIVLKHEEKKRGYSKERRKKIILSIRNKKGTDKETRKKNNKLKAILRLFFKVLDHNANCFRNERIILDFKRKKTKTEKNIFKGELVPLLTMADIKKNVKHKTKIKSIIEYRRIWRTYIRFKKKPKNMNNIRKIKKIYDNPLKYGLEYKNINRTIETIKNN